MGELPAMPHPLWMLAQVLAALFSMQLCANSPGKQWRMGQVRGPLHPCGMPRRIAQLLDLDWPNSGHGGYVGSESWEKTLPLSFFENKNKNIF